MVATMQEKPKKKEAARPGATSRKAAGAAQDKPSITPPETAEQLRGLLEKARERAKTVSSWENEKRDRADAEVAALSGRLELAVVREMPEARRVAATIRFEERDVPMASIVITGNHREEDDEAETARLARTLVEYGLQQRIGLKDLGDGRYELIFGSRRRKAAASLGWAEIQAKVYPPALTPVEVEFVRTIENFGRKDLTPVERAMAVARNIESIEQSLRPLQDYRNSITVIGEGADKDIGDLDLALVPPARGIPACVIELAREIRRAGGLHAYVGQRLGFPTNWVQDNAYVSRLGGDARRLLASRQIDVGHARKLAKLGDPDQANQIARWAARTPDGLGGRSVKDVDEQVMSRMRSLRVVPWRLDVAFGRDEKAGCHGWACLTCKFTSNADQTLWGGALSNDPAAGSCTNGKCFDVKSAVVEKDLKAFVEKARKAVKRDGTALTETGLSHLIPIHIKPPTAVRRAKREIEPEGGGISQGDKASSAGGRGQPAERKLSPEETAKNRYDQLVRTWNKAAAKSIEKALSAVPGRRATLWLLERSEVWRSAVPPWNAKAQDFEKARKRLQGKPAVDAFASLAAPSVDAIAKLESELSKIEGYHLDRVIPEAVAALAAPLGVTIAPPPSLERLVQEERDKAAGVKPAAAPEAPAAAKPAGKASSKGKRRKAAREDGPAADDAEEEGAAGNVEAFVAKLPAKEAGVVWPANVNAYLAEMLPRARAFASSMWAWLMTEDDGVPEPTDDKIDVLNRQLIADRLLKLAEEAGIEPDAAKTRDGPAVARCRECGCTDDDCNQCIARTGRPCHWVKPDLCSACVAEPVSPAATTWVDRMEACATADEARTLFGEHEKAVESLQRSMGLTPTCGEIGPKSMRGFSTAKRPEWWRAVADATLVDPAKGAELEALIGQGHAIHEGEKWDALRAAENSKPKAATEDLAYRGRRANLSISAFADEGTWCVRWHGSVGALRSESEGHPAFGGEHRSYRAAVTAAAEQVDTWLRVLRGTRLTSAQAEGAAELRRYLDDLDKLEMDDAGSMPAAGNKAAVAATIEAHNGVLAAGGTLGEALDAGARAVVPAGPKPKHVAIADDVAYVLRHQTACVGRELKLAGERLDPQLYKRVDKVLQLLSGKWTKGKVQAHVFPSDAKPLIDAALGDGKVLDAKKTYQFFQTPAELAKRMVELAEIRPGMTVLEPSAGRGAIAESIRERMPEGCDLQLVELDDANVRVLAGKGFCVSGVDFLAWGILPGSKLEFDRVLMNPPFSSLQDVDHVRHAFDLLKPSGRLVAIMSPSAFFREDAKSKAWRAFLDGAAARVVLLEELPAGTFAASGTDVAAKLLVLDKPAAAAPATQELAELVGGMSAAAVKWRGDAAVATDAKLIAYLPKIEASNDDGMKSVRRNIVRAELRGRLGVTDDELDAAIAAKGPPILSPADVGCSPGDVEAACSPHVLAMAVGGKPAFVHAVLEHAGREWLVTPPPVEHLGAGDDVYALRPLCGMVTGKPSDADPYYGREVRVGVGANARTLVVGPRAELLLVRDGGEP